MRCGCCLRFNLPLSVLFSENMLVLFVIGVRPVSISLIVCFFFPSLLF